MVETDLDKAFRKMKERVNQLEPEKQMLRDREKKLEVRHGISYTMLNEINTRRPLRTDDIEVESIFSPNENFDIEIKDKIYVKHPMEKSEMTKYVCNGATLECPHLKGNRLVLNVFEERLIFVKHEPIATSEDCNKENFSLSLPFGHKKCSKTGKDCLKCIDAYWEEETLAPYVFLNGARPVLKKSILRCRVDKEKEIKFLNSGQDFGMFQGIKNYLLNFHDENPWLIRVGDGLFNYGSAAKTGVIILGATKINPLFGAVLAVELGDDLIEDYNTGYGQMREGLMTSPLGFIAKPWYENIADPINRFTFGEHEEENRQYNDEEFNKFRKSVIEKTGEDYIEKKATSIPEFIINYGKERIVDKVVENRRPIYDYLAKKNNDTAVQFFIPTKEYSDSTVEFLTDSYVTVIFEYDVPYDKK